MRKMRNSPLNERAAGEGRDWEEINPIGGGFRQVASYIFELFSDDPTVRPSRLQV